MKILVIVLTVLLALLINQCRHSSCTEIEITAELEDIELRRPPPMENVYADIQEKIDWLSFSHSPVDLWHLTMLEENLFPIIKNYASNLDREVEYFFQRYIADYEESTVVAFNGWNSTKEPHKQTLIHRNPLLAHRMIWRFVTDFPLINKVLLSSGDSELLNAYRKFVDESSIWPTDKDLSNSMDSLLTIHFVYDLNLTEFTNGIISKVVTNASLSAIHCFEISKYALRTNKQYTLALEWLEIAETKRLNVSGHPILDYLDKTTVAELLEEIIAEHDTSWRQEPPFHNNLYSYYDKIDSDYILISQKKQLQYEYKNKGDGVKDLSLNDVAAYSTLCKGGNLQSEKEKSELYCWYESKINPAWYINPQKMELYSKDPYLFQVYDFVGDELVRYLKRQAIPKMERSMVTHTNLTALEAKESNYSKTRTSMYAWLSEWEFAPRLPVLTQRIGYLTGLSASWDQIDTSSSVQVSIYATGGQFNVHVDPLRATGDYENLLRENIGDRLATFMLYLNTVEHGGNTAFSSVGVAVPPVKGSAVFWYDSLYNGEVDFRAWHGGCPVLIGEKWVANKWIHNNLNILKRKCTLNKDE